MDESDRKSPSARYTRAAVLEQQKIAREATPWTTTRCHRLLRPLKTHIIALRREIELENAEAQDEDGHQADEFAGMSRRAPRGRPKIQHTYSRRGRPPANRANACSGQPPETPRPPRTSSLSSRKATQPGEIVLPTPVIRRARGQQLSSPVQQPSDQTAPSGLRGPGSRPPSLVSALEVDMRPLRARVSPTRYSLYESILRAMHALLVATGEPAITTKPSRTTGMGGRSLMDMCLRRIPEYIDELEDWERREAQERGTWSAMQNSEVSSEVYEAVEAMLPPGRGCPQLRKIVRAHGIKVVTNAVIEGLFDEGFSILLLGLCSKTKSVVEAESLFEAVLDRSYQPPKAVGSTFDEARNLAPLKVLREFARESRRPQLMLRQLSRLVSQQLLPLSWFSTKELSTIWSEVVKNLSGSNACDDTASFASLTILMLAGQARTTPFSLRPESDNPRYLSQHTLISAITAVAALPLLRQESLGSSAYMATSISKRAAYIIYACIYEMRRPRKAGWIATVLRLAAYFTTGQQYVSKGKSMAEVWTHVMQNRDTRDGKQHYEAAIALICCLAQACGRGTAGASHHHVTKLCDQLDSLVSPVEASTSRKVRMDCAFLLAERTNDMRDLAFAESLGSAGTADVEVAGPTPRKQTASSSFAGYRWDEGISEWVTATPAMQKRQSECSLPPPLTSAAAAAPSRSSSWSCDSDSSNEASRDSDAELGYTAGHGENEDKRRARPRAISASAKRSGLVLSNGQQQGQTLTRATTTRAQQRQASAAPRKRARSSTRLLKTQVDSTDEEDECEDDDDEDESDSYGQKRRKKNYAPSTRRSLGSRGAGQENRVVAVVPARGHVAPPPGKQPCTSAAVKPRRSILRAITNMAHGELLSDDELGL